MVTKHKHETVTLKESRRKDIYSHAVPSVSKGNMTLKVPFTVFRENRERLVQELRKVKPRALVIIKAASSVGCAAERTHEQDPNFFWAFGCQESAAIGAIDVITGKSFLIVPRSCNVDSCRKREMRSEIRNRYMVEGVRYLEDMENSLGYIMHDNCSEILILDYQKLELPVCVYKYEVVPDVLCNVVHNLMAQVTQKEIKILRYIAKNLEGAIIHIMHRFRPGMSDNQLEAWFSFFMAHKGGFDQLNLNILSADDALDRKSNLRRSYLARRERVFKEGELCVIEAGASYFGLKISLGIVIPVSENFNSYQEKAYEAMLRVRLSIYKEVEAGLPVDCLRKAAERTLLTFLVDSKLVCGTVDGAFEHGVGTLLMPHSLVRSVGGCGEDPKELELGKQYLIRPGCCFDKRLLGKAYQDNVVKQYLTEELHKYEGILIRVSDPIIITIDGFLFLSNMPRSWCTINDMRSKEQFEKFDSTIEFEKQNLMVSPSFFSI